MVGLLRGTPTWRSQRRFKKAIGLESVGLNLRFLGPLRWCRCSTRFLFSFVYFFVLECFGVGRFWWGVCVFSCFVFFVLGALLPVVFLCFFFRCHIFLPSHGFCPAWLLYTISSTCFSWFFTALGFLSCPLRHFFFWLFEKPAAGALG